MMDRQGLQDKGTGNMQLKRLLTVDELAHMIGLSRQTIYNKMSQGLFPIKHKRIGQLVRFDVREVERYIKSLPDEN